MKRTDILKMVLANILLVVCILSPFFPGPSNPIVIGLSLFGQYAGYAGLILIPPGLTWLTIEIINYRSNGGLRFHKLLKVLAWIIVAGLAIFFLVFTFAIIHQNGFITGLTMLLMGSIALITGTRKSRKPMHGINVLPIYLVFLPLTSLLAIVYLVPAASDRSRSQAIRQSMQVVNMLEEYHSQAGHYPQRLDQLYDGHDPVPRVMGIKGFRYNLIGDQYTLSFTQWLDLGSLEEIVLYDRYGLRNIFPADCAANDYKQDHCRVNLAFAGHDTGFRNWRYYHLD